jgi:hypothetical protein
MAEPPPKHKKRWHLYAMKLAANPGEWDLTLEGAPTQYAKSVGYQSLRRAGCETTLRYHPGGTADVWARWPPLAEKTTHDAHTERHEEAPT